MIRIAWWTDEYGVGHLSADLRVDEFAGVTEPIYWEDFEGLALFGDALQQYPVTDPAPRYVTGYPKADRVVDIRLTMEPRAVGSLGQVALCVELSAGSDEAATRRTVSALLPTTYQRLGEFGRALSTCRESTKAGSADLDVEVILGSPVPPGWGE